MESLQLFVRFPSRRTLRSISLKLVFYCIPEAYFWNFGTLKIAACVMSMRLAHFSP